MKLCILIYLAIFASAQQAIPADVDSLATTFDHQRDAQAVQTAEKFFRLLAEDGFTDELVRIIPGSSMDSVRAVTWFWAGEWYYDLQDYDKALSSASKALAFSREAGLRELECDCCNTLSIVWFRKADYSKALEYARETLDIGRELRDESRIAYSLNTLAGICLVSKQASEGVKYITEAIRICEKQKDSIKLAVRCGMAAEIYHSLGEEDRSLEYARRAYDINIAMGLKDKAAIRLSQMAAAQIALGGRQARPKPRSWRLFRNLRDQATCTPGPSAATSSETSASRKATAPPRHNTTGTRSRSSAAEETPTT